MMGNVFLPAEILIPKKQDLEKWAVIACDQFSSQREYWENVRDEVGNEISCLHMILPEAELNCGNEEGRIRRIHQTMDQYLEEGIFDIYEDSYVYVERELANGSIRRGVVGMIDLEEYDYSDEARSMIRATERTVVERIPPRMRIRRNAQLDLTHAILLCDDNEQRILDSLTSEKEFMKKLYDFELMQDGGTIAGWLVDGELKRKFIHLLEEYTCSNRDGLFFAVGDGNHSLATAKACYEELKRSSPDEDFSGHPMRYALVELENIHDKSQQFEPIHRLIEDVDPVKLLDEMKAECCGEEGYPVRWIAGDQNGVVYLKPELGAFAVGIIQTFLDNYLCRNSGKIDYIHGNDVLVRLSRRENTIGFLLEGIDKNGLFSGTAKDGTLPRKTFSMGCAWEKRYYLEARKLK